MSGRRIYDVAKELGVSSKDLVQRLKDMGVEVKSHSSTIGEDVIARLKGDAGAEAPKPRSESADVVRQEPARRQVPTRPPARGDAPTRPTAAPPEPPAPPAEAAKPPAEKKPEPEPEPEPERAGGPVLLHHGVTIKEFADKVGKPAPQVIATLMRQGSMKSITQSMSDEEVLVVADELGVTVELVSPEEEEQILEEIEERTHAPAAIEEEVQLEPRPAVVTVMGHVDHGKTSLLDRIRQADVAAQEHGGITQHIGAYQVVKDGNRITFIDTPGHEAFTAMRARGAQATDLAILVVAADDGVMPQTLEAIDHARAAGVPIVVAVNKIDREEADPTRVRTQLADRGLQPQEWGGDTLFVDVSARTGANLDDLLVGITLVAEELDLKAAAAGPARGIVLESRLDKGRGAVGTVLVQRGTLRVGDALVAGAAWGKVRAMLDEYGEQVREAGPSRPVVVLGWAGVPQVGSEVRAVADERQARQLAQERDAARRKADLVTTPTRPRSLAELFDATAGASELNLIIKADVQGSVEALTDSFQKLDVGEVTLKVLHRGVGAVTENDVALAKASNALVIAFNVATEGKARQTADAEGVDIRSYRVIYQAIEDVERALKGLLAPEFREAVLGQAEIREIFRIPGGRVAGCYVTNGEIVRNAKARLVRDGTVVYESRIATLFRFRDAVRDVQQGFECGMTLEGYTDFKIGDVIEAFEVREISRT